MIRMRVQTYYERLGLAVQEQCTRADRIRVRRADPGSAIVGRLANLVTLESENRRLAEAKERDEAQIAALRTIRVFADA